MPIAQRAPGAIHWKALSKSFGEKRVFSGFSGSIEPTEFVSILGASGCGKSTLLRLIAGLESPTEGTVQVAAGSKSAYVFQDATLLPWRTVLGNVALPLELGGMPKAEREEKAREALKTVGLEDSSHLYPRALSGGMRMRASLARALVTKPDLLLLDEPFAALDELTRNRLGELLRELWLRTGMTVVFVTHAISEAVYLSERVIVLSPGPARVLADEKVSLPRERSKNTRGLAEFALETQRFRGILESGMAGALE